jgi:ribosome biogenesis ATPase
VPLPVSEERVSILKALTRNVALDRSPQGVDLEAVGGDLRTEGFSGADLANLVREAGMSVVKEWADEDPYCVAVDGEGNPVTEANEVSCISTRHFEEAFKKVRPSVSATDRMSYERVQAFIKQGMGAIEALRAAASSRQIKTL